MTRQKFHRLGGGVRDRRQLIDIDEHQISRILRRVRILGKDDGNRLSDISHALPCENRLLVRLEVGVFGRTEIDQGNFGDIRRRPDRNDPVHYLCSGRVDAADETMRDVRPDDPHMQRAGKRPVGGKSAGSGKKRAVFQPQNTLTDLSALQAIVTFCAHLQASCTQRAIPSNDRSARYGATS